MYQYKELYLFLFNRITDALARFDDGQPDCAKSILISARKTAEQMYIESDNLK